MPSHFHAVVGVPGDPAPEKILSNLKSYGAFGKPVSDTWWASNGSTRKLADETAIKNAIEYVRNQEEPLLVWVADEETIWRAVLNMKKRAE